MRNLMVVCMLGSWLCWCGISSVVVMVLVY